MVTGATTGSNVCRLIKAIAVFAGGIVGLQADGYKKSTKRNNSEEREQKVSYYLC